MVKCSAEDCNTEAYAKGLCAKHYVRMRRTGVLTTTRHMGDFWSKVKRGEPSECWPWTGFTRESGHGLTSHKGLPMHTSRKAWFLTRGAIPPGLVVCHKCDNKVCCNPDHMYLGTPADNALDHFEQPAFEDRGARTRRTLLTEKDLERLWKMRAGGAFLKDCAAHFGVHIATICKYITAARKAKLESKRQNDSGDSRAI